MVGLLLPRRLEQPSELQEFGRSCLVYQSWGTSTPYDYTIELRGRVLIYTLRDHGRLGRSGHGKLRKFHFRLPMDNTPSVYEMAYRTGLIEHLTDSFGLRLSIPSPER